MNNKLNQKLLGETLVVNCVRLLSDGSGVGYQNGIATFVPGLLPGEIGEITIYEAKKKWQRGHLQRVTKHSPLRLDPPCTVYEQCGGCQLQHTTYEETLEWKQHWVKEALSRIGKIDVAVNPTIGMEKPWRYRNKVRLHRESDGQIGYYKEKSKVLVDFQDCLLLSERMNHWIRLTREYLTGSYPEIHTLTFRENTKAEGLLLLEGTPERVLSAEGNSDFFKALSEQGIRSVWGTDSEGRANLIWGEAEFGQMILDMTFEVSPLSFLQVNSQQTDVLYKLVLEGAALTGEEIVWDLYSGIGTLTLAMAKKAKKVTGIEENPFAVENAVQNAVNNQAIGHVEFLLGKVEQRMMKLEEQPDVVVLDPPRAGMHPEVVQRLLELKPPSILYVSCDPGTLARDLGMLTQGGYKVSKVQPVDMFPWTMHVETVIVLYRS